MSKPPFSEHYDAMVDLAGSLEFGMVAYAIAKFAYTISGGACQPASAEPLFHDVFDPDIQPRLRAGSDFWPRKEATDFVVQGEAYGPQDRRVSRMVVSVQVGQVGKSISVFGRRPILWKADGRVAIEPPEPFVSIPLTYASAFGGIDFRVPVEELETLPVQLKLDVDHPGMYPRNPFGKGYLVEPGEVPDMEMPNLEDPDDLLTPERLVVRDPRLWYRQPLPWCFDWMHPVMFPRYAFLSDESDAWYPGPEDEQLPEVRRGFLSSGYRSAMANRGLVEGADHRYYQEASHGLILSDLHGDEPVVLRGMHPIEPVLRFNLPGAPLLEVEVEGRREAVQPRLHSVVCRPADMKVLLVWGGHCPLPRPFLPGIHKTIPVGVSVNKGKLLRYQAPPTVREQAAAAQAAAAQAKG